MSSVPTPKKDSNRHESTEGKELQKILDSYKVLLDNQASERNLLLEKVNEITLASENVVQMDTKMDSLVNLLLDIKEQIIAISTIKSEIKIPENSSNRLDDKKIESVVKEVEREGEFLLSEISELKGKIESNEIEIVEKDIFINELNDQLELLAFEKSQLISKVENLNSLTEQWGEEIDLLQKLAVSDPRYKAIDTLKKHGSLSEIQLAFSMGTSIGQVKRYAEDLIKLQLIRRDSSGRYVWIGRE